MLMNVYYAWRPMTTTLVVSLRAETRSACLTPVGTSPKPDPNFTGLDLVSCFRVFYTVARCGPKHCPSSPII